VAFDPMTLRPVPVAQLDLHALAHHQPGKVGTASANVPASATAVEESATA